MGDEEEDDEAEGVDSVLELAIIVEEDVWPTRRSAWAFGECIPDALMLRDDIGPGLKVDAVETMGVACGITAPKSSSSSLSLGPLLLSPSVTDLAPLLAYNPMLSVDLVLRNIRRVTTDAAFGCRSGKNRDRPSRSLSLGATVGGGCEDVRRLQRSASD